MDPNIRDGFFFGAFSVSRVLLPSGLGCSQLCSALVVRCFRITHARILKLPCGAFDVLSLDRTMSCAAARSRLLMPKDRYFSLAP